MKKFDGFTDVNGKPFFALGTQAHNSSSYSREMIAEACRAAAALNCNTLEAPIYWERIEADEGRFDFSSIEVMVDECRRHGLRLVVLWFASWKNGDLSYAPLWIKRDETRFPRVLRANGLPTSNLSAHYRENMEADARAFEAVMERVKEIDGRERTIIAMQIENEPGFLNTDRDHAPRALENQEAPVPPELLAYLEKHADCAPGADWKRRGRKRGASWAGTFGIRGYEYCEAWHMAKYIDAVAARGKARYDLPMYVNVALNDGTPWGIPGMEYPGGGAVARTLYVWQAAVEHIDFVAPDIYEQNYFCYEKIVDHYGNGENALFVPESSYMGTGPCNMFYAIGRGAIGYATFGAESALDAAGNVIAAACAESNLAVKNAIPLILKHRNTGKIHAVVQRIHAAEEMARRHYPTRQSFEFEQYLGMVNLAESSAFGFDYASRRERYDGPRAVSRGLIIEDDPKTFYLTGYFNLKLLAKKCPDVTQVNERQDLPLFAAIEEGHFDGDDAESFVVDRTRNGDEAFRGFWTTPACGVVRIRLV